MAGIKISPKYGVNPTIPVCFWCGNEKNEIAFMGRLGNGKKGEDFEAPMKAIIDFVPCDKCKNAMAQDFTVVEVTAEPNGRTDVEMQKGAYPTGRYVVIKSEAAERMFRPDVLSRGKCMMLADEFEQVFGAYCGPTV